MKLQNPIYSHAKSGSLSGQWGSNQHTSVHFFFINSCSCIKGRKGVHLWDHGCCCVCRASAIKPRFFSSVTPRRLSHHQLSAPSCISPSHSTKSPKEYMISKLPSGCLKWCSRSSVAVRTDPIRYLPPPHVLDRSLCWWFIDSYRITTRNFPGRHYIKAFSRLCRSGDFVKITEYYARPPNPI